MVKDLNQPKRKMRLGDILKAQGIITGKQLEAALAIQQKTKQKLGDILIEMGVTTESQITNALHAQLGIEMIELRGIKIPPRYRLSAAPYCAARVLPSVDEKDSNTLIWQWRTPDIVARTTSPSSQTAR